MTLEPTDLIDGSPDIDKPITENQIRVNPPARELQLIDLSKRFLAAAHYWSLPAQFVGVKVIIDYPIFRKNKVDEKVGFIAITYLYCSFTPRIADMFMNHG